MNIETIKRLAAEVWPEGVVVLPSDMTFLEQFTALVLAEERVPEQTLNFLDGSKVVIRECPLISNMAWESGPERKTTDKIEMCRDLAVGLADLALGRSFDPISMSTAEQDEWSGIYIDDSR
jgi:hypothetical protein